MPKPKCLTSTWVKLMEVIVKFKKTHAHQAWGIYMKLVAFI